MTDGQAVNDPAANSKSRGCRKVPGIVEDDEWQFALCNRRKIDSPRRIANDDASFPTFASVVTELVQFRRTVGVES